ncbi:UDP-glucose/GDP-mannose dehydrogenase family protein [Desmospora activa]|uniref:Nucleotide sugar dehydrogenase n=1 Tax=Desmospora activa DSM 45169 TaxID=1121389 RepID=A0A2T4Z6H8_9BACL|nr:UDP-glucose/GDP-mannose dehydrogenase family protein [Desmospora activa]PTM57484.1 nucleotide sugar dehydrogenase [Desmospora activa DSM 45169]
MRIAVLGSGASGLVTGACLAELGHEIWCVDFHAAAPDNFVLQPWEPGLNDLLLRAVNNGRIHFTTDQAGAIADADIIFIAVENVNGDGNSDLSVLWNAADLIQHHGKQRPLTVILGDIPLGTTRSVQDSLGEAADVAHQAEFFRPGNGVEDFFQAEQLLIGTDSPRAHQILAILYQSLSIPVIGVAPVESEWTQYAAKTLRSMKHSYTQRLSRIHKNTAPSYASL